MAALGGAVSVCDIVATDKSAAAMLNAGPRGRTGRDLAVVSELARFSACTVAQIQRRHFTGRTAAHVRLQRIAEHGLLHHVRLLAGEAGVYVATGPGAELADVDLPAARFRPHQLAHTLAVVDMADRLLREHPGSTWTTNASCGGTCCGPGARRMGGWGARG